MHFTSVMSETDQSTQSEAGSRQSEPEDSSDENETPLVNRRTSSTQLPAFSKPMAFTFRAPLSIKATMATRDWNTDREFHESLLDADERGAGIQEQHEEIRTTPLFTANVLERVINSEEDDATSSPLLPQYSLLAKVLETYEDEKKAPSHPETTGNRGGGRQLAQHPTPNLPQHDQRLFVNINAPWSAFICGSQGSGKSHTLSCMLESSLKPSRLGPLVKPLAGMVFHFDKFAGFDSSQECEAAYLCSQGIPVTVLVAATSLHRMRKVYKTLRGVPKDKLPEVMPLYFQESQLNVERMMKLMAIEDDGRTALYMEVVNRILRSMALAAPESPGLNYKEFVRRLDLESFNPAQSAMIKMRLGLLESFLALEDVPQGNQARKPAFGNSKKGKAAFDKQCFEDDDRQRNATLGKDTRLSFEPGSLTIIDLSCPFVDESAACVMFNICLALFLEGRAEAGRIIALDEAHKFMTGTSSANVLTDSLLSVIRLQRHLAARVIIATQEPTISPSLLDLCSMTIVHRFTSPEWLRTLQSHLAGVSGGLDEESAKKNLAQIFRRIVILQPGQALLFSPSSMMRAVDNRETDNLRIEKLGLSYVKIRVRKRLTVDGGRSVLAA